MNIGELLKRWGVHFWFVGTFLFVWTISVVLNTMDNQTVPQAMLAALREIRPFDYVLFAAFWWYVATHRRESDSRSTLTTLGLSSRT